ncbi:MAG: hypothetical protein O7G85_11875, partial [Planctomycetota bacterium]|nr:hypothetical protein [Planctomycetota bacterium]
RAMCNRSLNARTTSLRSAVRGTHINAWSPAVRGTLLMAIVLLSSCRTDPLPEDTEGPPPPVTYETQRGPVQFKVRANPGILKVGDKVTLSIEVTAEPDVAIGIPIFEETLGEFDIDDANLPPDIPEGERRRWTHTYTLSTFDDGDLEIPAITIHFRDHRNLDDVIEGDMVSDPLKVVVKSVLDPTQSADQTSMRDIKDLVDIPVDRGLPGWVVAVVAVFALAVILIFSMVFFKRRQQIAREEAYVPLHIWAMLQLEKLEQDRLIESHEIHTFYIRLSDIVRRYIERRYGLRAPERTTEEFLREMQRSRFLSVGHKELLSGFLRSADMVKFALHEPIPEDCQEAFVAASRFVGETRPTPEEQEDLKISELKDAAA